MALDLSFLEEAVNSTSVTRGAPLIVSLDLVDEDPDNPRKEFANLAEFAADVKARGILQPLIVHPAVNGRYMIRFGARRYRAAKLAGLGDVPIFVAGDPRQFDDYSQVAENRQRVPLSPMEEATFIQKRLNAGDKRKDIATKMQIQGSAITALLSLIDPPQFLIELYQSGRCTIPDYLYRLRTLHGTNPELVESSVATADDITRKFIDALTGMITDVVKPPALRADPSTATDGAIPSGKPETQDKSPITAPNSRYNVILVKHQGKAAQLLLDRPATTVGLGWIKCLHDGSEIEAVLSDCTLDSLLEK